VRIHLGSNITLAISARMILETILGIFGSIPFQFILFLTICYFVYLSLCGPELYSGIPAVGIDTKHGFWATLDKARENWFLHGKEIMDQGLKQGCFK
jgi:hypothetical protein